MSLIGTEIGKMHLADVVHGDLTTSNMMLRSPSSPPSSFLETSLVRVTSERTKSRITEAHRFFVLMYRS